MYVRCTSLARVVCDVFRFSNLKHFLCSVYIDVYRLSVLCSEHQGVRFRPKDCTLQQMFQGASWPLVCLIFACVQSLDNWCLAQRGLVLVDLACSLQSMTIYICGTAREFCYLHIVKLLQHLNYNLI